MIMGLRTLIAIGIIVGMLSPGPAFAGNASLPSKVLNVYNWEDYFGDTTIRDFERKSGVKVNLRTYKNEEEMLSAVQSDPAKYDIIIISGSMVREMKDLRLLAPIDFRNVRNFQNIESMFRNPVYDPGNRFSVPYMWGTTAIAVNRKYVKGTIDSWKVLFDPKYKKKIALLEDMDEVIGMALKADGHSINSNNEADLDSARKLLRKQKAIITGYSDCIKIRSDLISERIWLAQEFSGEAGYAADKNENVEYVIPREGASIWVDNICIPRDSRNKPIAEMFINYILDAGVSAKIANYLWYANCNKAAAKYTKKEILTDSSIYPRPDILKRCELFRDMGTDQEIGRGHALRNRIWSELKAK